MDEITRLREFRAAAQDPADDIVAAARGRLFAQFFDAPARRTRITTRHVFVAVALAVSLLGGAGALAAGGILDGKILSGPPAPAENDAALRALFPPFKIGHARELATYEGRKLFGARTARGGYCFSSPSPIDPRGEGGHCVSAEEARRLDAGGTVAFSTGSGGVGGFAPGASEVHISGAGIDVTFPVGPNGWWLGDAGLQNPPPLPLGGEAFVVATSLRADGEIVGRDPLMRVNRAKDGSYWGYSAI